MFSSWLRSHLNLKNLLTLVCGSLALFLICQEFVTLTVTKPTTTSREERELETSDLPEVVVCLVPGFDHDAILKYYDTLGKYHNGQKGLFGKKKTFVGWNGGRNENKSSRDILEEVLTFEDQFINSEGGLFIQIHYRTEHSGRVPVVVKPRILAYPYGRCMSISPPSQNITSDTVPNSLSLWIRNKNNKARFRVFFMNQVSSLRLYPNEMEMEGDPIDIQVDRAHWRKVYIQNQNFSEHPRSGGPSLQV